MMTATAVKAKKSSNFGHIVSFYPRGLGVRHNYEEPIDFLANLVELTTLPTAIVDYVLAGKAKWLQFQPDIDSDGWDLIADHNHNDRWDVISSFAAIRGNIPEIAEMLVCCLELPDLYALAQTENVILPVYQPDASGPFLQTDLAGPPWKTGQAGWVFADRDTVLKHLGASTLDTETREQAKHLLKARVESRVNPKHRATDQGGA